MPLSAKSKVEVPATSLPSFVFESPTATLSDSPIILDPERPHDRFLTLNTYRHWSQCFASGLRSKGFQKGDRVLFISGNSIAWPVVFMGTIMAGGVLTGVSPTLPFDALMRLATGLEPKFILADAKGFDSASRAAAEIGLPKSDVFLFDRESLFTGAAADEPDHYWTLLLDLKGASFDWTAHTSSEQLAVINYTSGSTGYAKGCMVTHRNIVANAVQYLEQQKADPKRPEKGYLINWVNWCPFYHVIGQNQFCVIGPKRGIHNYVMEDLDLESLLRYTEKYRPPVMLLVPPLMVALISHPARKRFDLSSVLNVAVGGAPLREAFLERFRAFMPNPDCRIIQGWGMTEITHIATCRHPLDRDSSECVGELLPNVQAKVMAPDRVTEIVGPHKSGEIWIRSPNVTKGYWRNSEKTASTYYPDGWLRTGDFGYYDNKQRFFIRDRIQDIIYPSTAPGAYILPTDLETVLLDMPGILDVGVTSVELLVNEKKELVPRGFVVVDEAVAPSSEAVLNSFNAKVEPHERLVGGLYIVKDIPKVTTAQTAKVDRLALRALNV